MDIQNLEPKQIGDMGEASVKALIPRLERELESLPEPGIPHAPDVHRANGVSILARAARKRLEAIDKHIPKPSEPWTRDRVEAWATDYREKLAAHERSQREREAFITQAIRERVGDGVPPATGVGAESYRRRVAEAREAAEKHAPKLLHERPGLPDGINHPKDFQSFQEALRDLMSFSGPLQRFAAEFVRELPADLKGEAEARGVTESAQAFEYRLRNPDDMGAAKRIESMHPAESSGLLDGADPAAGGALPGVTEVRGEASLDAWLEWAAQHPSVRDRVAPHVQGVLDEAVARGWLTETGQRHGGFPLYHCPGSGMTFKVPDQFGVLGSGERYLAERKKIQDDHQRAAVFGGA